VNLSVVIPAYNEANNIKATVEELLKVIGRISDIGDVKVVVVDDHSSDNTYDMVRNMKDPRVMCLRLSRRSGSHAALRAGFIESNGDFVMCLSADGQDDPNCLNQMLLKLCSGCNIVWALRKNRNKESLILQLFAKTFYKTLLKLTGSDQSGIDLSRADFYMLDRSVLEAIKSCTERNTSLFGLISWLGFKQEFVEYERRERKSGLSKWSFRSRFRLARDWIVAFSGLPLKLMSLVGFFVALSGFLYALYVIFNAFSGNPIDGWSSIMVAVLILGGIQMIMLGVVGEYLWRNLDESRKRPLYFIEKKTQKNHE
jgi:dolichol-phosphate mannosyltransferase